MNRTLGVESLEAADSEVGNNRLTGLAWFLKDILGLIQEAEVNVCLLLNLKKDF